MTMHTYTLPDKTISPVAIPARRLERPERLWTPSSWQTVGSAAGYTYSIACGDAKAHAFSSESNRPKYQTEFRAKIEGNNIASEWAGSENASAVDMYQQVWHPPVNPDEQGTYTWEYFDSYQYDGGWNGEYASSFSRTDGQVVKLWADIKVTEHACTVSDLKLYVWS